MTRRENVIAAMEHKKTLWTPNVVTDCNMVLQSAVMERYEGKGSGPDEFGCMYDYNEAARGPVHRIEDRVVKDIPNWREELHFPDLRNRDWEAAAARDTAGWDRENRFTIVQMFNGMFERAHMTMGFQEVVCALLEEPEAMEEYFQAFEDYRIEVIRNIAKYYKPDAMHIFDDYGTESSLMMSPGTWRELIKPHLKRTIQAVHDCGMYYILHSDGYIAPLFEDFIELGADAVQPLQICNRPGELKKQYSGQICFCGGFDNVGVLDRENATEEATRREVRRMLSEMADGQSYVAWRSTFCRHPDVYMNELSKFIVPQIQAAGETVCDELMRYYTM